MVKSRLTSDPCGNFKNYGKNTAPKISVYHVQPSKLPVNTINYSKTAVTANLVKEEWQNMGQLLACNWTLPHLTSSGSTVLSRSGPWLSWTPRKEEGGREVITEALAGWGPGSSQHEACGWQNFWWLAQQWVQVPKKFIRAPSPTNPAVGLCWCQYYPRRVVAPTTPSEWVETSEGRHLKSIPRKVTTWWSWEAMKEEAIPWAQRT